MSLRSLLFSAQGRIPRSTWWIFNLPLMGIVILGILLIVLFGPEDSSDVLGLIFTCSFGVFCILMIYPTLMVNLKRFHDLDKAGWSLLWIYVPAVLVVLSIIFVFSEMSAVGESAFYVAAIILVIAWIITYAAFLIELGFIKGTNGANKYGPDPLIRP